MDKCDNLSHSKVVSFYIGCGVNPALSNGCILSKRKEEKCEMSIFRLASIICVKQSATRDFVLVASDLISGIFRYSSFVTLLEFSSVQQCGFLSCS